MAINAYTGVMGSGKSFEVVASVILPAIENGRRVVTNVDGISEERIHEYLIRIKKVDPAKLGRVVHVKNEDIVMPGFFPDEGDPDRSSVVQGGDLVAIDEAWRFWGQGEKITAEHMQFFRMHRHYVHLETKVTCDVVLMVQAIGDLNRNLKAVVEMTCVMTKLKTLGLNTSYRVEMYEGGRTVKTAKFETYVKRYDKRIFPLYQSYSGGQGKEKAIDKRQNVLRNPRVWLVAVGMLLMCVISGYYLWWFFKGRMVKAEVSSSAMASASVAASSGSGVSSVQSPVVSKDTLRIAGEVVINGSRWIVISDEGGRFWLESPAGFSGRGVLMMGTVNGQRVDAWLVPPLASAQVTTPGGLVK